MSLFGVEHQASGCQNWGWFFPDFWPPLSCYFLRTVLKLVNKEWQPKRKIKKTWQQTITKYCDLCHGKLKTIAFCRDMKSEKNAKIF